MLPVRTSLLQPISPRSSLDMVDLDNAEELRQKRGQMQRGIDANFDFDWRGWF
jgi:hypothetical protein